MAWLVGIINAGVIGAVVAPTIGFAIGPLLEKKPRAQWLEILDEGELKNGETRSVVYEAEVQDGYMLSKQRGSVYLHRDGTQVEAFDPTCPHLGCHVQWQPARNEYVCPCHGGVFDAEGNRVSGPPPRGLSRIATRVENGKIWIHKV
jgi:menaquinol-cytochrome c reductase iron-sulfur subunit